MVSDTVAEVTYRVRQVLDRHWSLPWLVVPSGFMATLLLLFFLLLGYSLGSTVGVVAGFLGLCAAVLVGSVSIEWVVRRLVAARNE